MDRVGQMRFFAQCRGSVAVGAVAAVMVSRWQFSARHCVVVTICCPNLFRGDNFPSECALDFSDAAKRCTERSSGNLSAFETRWQTTCCFDIFARCFYGDGRRPRRLYSLRGRGAGRGLET